MLDSTINDEQYEGLTDLNLAAFLATRDVHPDDIKPQPYSGFCTFLYDPTAAFSKAMQEWKEGPPVEVDVSRFMQVRRRLLDAVNEAQKEVEG